MVWRSWTLSARICVSWNVVIGWGAPFAFGSYDGVYDKDYRNPRCMILGKQIKKCCILLLYTLPCGRRDPSLCLNSQIWNPPRHIDHVKNICMLIERWGKQHESNQQQHYTVQITLCETYINATWKPCGIQGFQYDQDRLSSYRQSLIKIRWDDKKSYYTDETISWPSHLCSGNS